MLEFPEQSRIQLAEQVNAFEGKGEEEFELI